MARDLLSDLQHLLISYCLLILVVKKRETLSNLYYRNLLSLIFLLPREALWLIHRLINESHQFPKIIKWRTSSQST